MGGAKNENSSPLDQTQPNFVYIFLWAPRRLEMQKLTTQNGEGTKIKILARWTKPGQILYTYSVDLPEG